MKFAQEHIPAILNRQKWSTIRFRFHPKPGGGDHLVMLTPDAQAFAKSVVQTTSEMTPQEIVRHDWDGHESYDSTERFVDQMKRYYPDRGIGTHNSFEVYVWDPDSLNIHPDWRMGEAQA